MMPVPNVKMRPRLDKKIPKNWVQRSREKLSLWLYLRWRWGGGGFLRSVEVWNCVGGFSEGTAYHTVFKPLQYFQIVALFSNYSTAFAVLHCYQPNVFFSQTVALFSNYLTVFKILQYFQTIALFSDYCTGFKLLHCFQTIAQFSNYCTVSKYCTVFKILHCLQTIALLWISVHKGVWRYRCFHSVN